MSARGLRVAGPLASPRGLHLAAPLAVASLLAGCASGEADAPRAEVVDLRAALERGARGRASDLALDARLAEEVTVAAVTTAVLERSPDAVAALERWAAALEQPAQVEALPDPWVSYGYSSMFRMHSVGVMQEVPWPAKLRADARAALALARAEGAAWRVQRLALREQAASAVIGLGLARRRLALQDEELALAARTADVARARYAAGQASQTDALTAELAHDALAVARVDLAGEVALAASALNALLDRPPGAALGPCEDPPAPGAFDAARALEDGLARAARRPELEGWDARADAARARADRADLGWVPDLRLGASYVRDFGQDEDELELEGGLSIPLGAARTRAAGRQAEAERREAAAQRRRAELQVADDVARAVARAAASAERHRALSDLALPRAARAVEAAEADYVAGRVDLAAWVEAQRALVGLRRALAEAAADHALARAALARAAGLP